jgi:hypothetical protein
VCTANGIAQGNKPALGAQAGEAALRDVLGRAGVHPGSRTADAPVHMLLEARP